MVSESSAEKHRQDVDVQLDDGFGRFGRSKYFTSAFLIENNFFLLIINKKTKG